MKYKEVVKVVSITRACNRILLDGALLAPYLVDGYKHMLTEDELKRVVFEECEVVYLGHNVITSYHDLIGQDTERNVFHLPCGREVHN